MKSGNVIHMGQVELGTAVTQGAELTGVGHRRSSAAASRAGTVRRRGLVQRPWHSSSVWLYTAAVSVHFNDSRPIASDSADHSVSVTGNGLCPPGIRRNNDSAMRGSSLSTASGTGCSSSRAASSLRTQLR